MRHLGGGTHYLVQVPAVGDTLQLVLAGILERESGTGDQVGGRNLLHFCQSFEESGREMRQTQNSSTSPDARKCRSSTMRLWPPTKDR